MPHRWQSCPHCKVHFAAPGGSGPAAACPACGKPLAAEPTCSSWYYARDGRSFGPVSPAQLKALAAAGTLSPGDLILKAGTKKWVRAADVKNLFPAPGLPATTTPASDPFKAATEFLSRHEALSEAQVVPEAGRCVQCICSYNCPIGIDVRAHAWRGKAINDSHCLTCSECVNRCPRGVLSFERIALFTVK